METEQKEQLVFLLVVATFFSVPLYISTALRGDSTEGILAVAGGMYVAALLAGAFGPTEDWAWHGVRLIQGETTPKQVLANSLQFYGLVAVGFGSGFQLATLVL